MKKSAGLLVHRYTTGQLEYFLVHPGGPFWKGKEEGAWSIPKGEFGDDEEPLQAAIREFGEETGQSVSGDFITLQPVKQKGGKWIHAFAVESEVDENSLQSNEVKIEWPYRSGRYSSFPEVDKGAWLNRNEALRLINGSQAKLVEELEALLNSKR